MRFSYISIIPSSLSLTDYLENPGEAAFSWKNVQGGENYKRRLSGLTYNLNIPLIYSKSTSIYYKSFVNEEMRPFNYLDENSKIIGIRHFGKFNISKSQASSAAAFPPLLNIIAPSTFNKLTT